jgi:riboflavin kinase/FMN adenylyltransferase
VLLIRDWSNLPAEVRGGAVSIGNFDGVHLGHARIMGRLREQAARCHGPAVAFTFDPHPVRLLRPDQAPPPLTWLDRKASLLEALGVSALIAYPTDERLLQLTPAAFFAEVVRTRLDAQALIEGPNFYFGHDRAGNVDVLRSLCAEAKIELEVVPPVMFNGQIVSSSRVRALIAGGDVQAAAELLTQPYRLRGMVTHGAGRGAKIGFPTANLDAIDTLLPANGVYASRAFVQGQAWPAAVNLGPNPTFGDQARKLEVHLIGWSAPLYGQALEVDFLSRLRDIQPFSSVTALQEQLRADVAAAAEIVRTWPAQDRTIPTN